LALPKHLHNGTAVLLPYFLTYQKPFMHMKNLKNAKQQLKKKRLTVSQMKQVKGGGGTPDYCDAWDRCNASARLLVQEYGNVANFDEYWGLYDQQLTLCAEAFGLECNLQLLIE